MSPYLRDNPHNRTLDEVLGFDNKPTESAKHVEGVRKTDTFFVAFDYQGQTVFRETDVGQTLGDVARDIGSGQYDAVAVFRASLADDEFEDYTGRTALLVLSYITENAYGPDDKLFNNSFMDAVMPRWKEGYLREHKAEQEYEDDKRFYARAGI